MPNKKRVIKYTKSEPLNRYTVSVGDLYLSATLPFYFLTFIYMGFSEIKDPSYIVDSLVFFVLSIMITAIGINKKSYERFGVSAGRHFFLAIPQKS